jgi:hypothetical protein
MIKRTMGPGNIIGTVKPLEEQSAWKRRKGFNLTYNALGAFFWPFQFQSWDDFLLLVNVR